MISWQFCLLRFLHSLTQSTYPQKPSSCWNSQENYVDTKCNVVQNVFAGCGTGSELTTNEKSRISSVRRSSSVKNVNTTVAQYWSFCSLFSCWMMLSEKEERVALLEAVRYNNLTFVSMIRKELYEIITMSTWVKLTKYRPERRLQGFLKLTFCVSLLQNSICCAKKLYWRWQFHLYILWLILIFL